MINETGLLPNLAKLRCGDSLLSVFLHQALAIRSPLFDLVNLLLASTSFTDKFSASVTQLSRAGILQSSSPSRAWFSQQLVPLHLTNKAPPSTRCERICRMDHSSSLGFQRIVSSERFSVDTQNFIQ